MEKINLKASTPASRFLAAAAGGRLKGAVVAEVVLTINGVQVPFESTFARYDAEIGALIDQAAETKALDLISGAGLQEPLHRLQAARMDIMRAFVTVRERCDTKPHVEPVV